jgi:hypothetical protein
MYVMITPMMSPVKRKIRDFQEKPSKIESYWKFAEKQRFCGAASIKKIPGITVPGILNALQEGRL